MEPVKRDGLVAAGGVSDGAVGNELFDIGMLS
jgi:hypothetical protein